MLSLNGMKAKRQKTFAEASTDVKPASTQLLRIVQKIRNMRKISSYPQNFLKMKKSCLEPYDKNIS